MKSTIDKFVYKNLWAILVAMVGIIVWGATLQAKVEAMTSREQANKGQFFNLVDTVMEIRDSQIRMEENIKFIKENIGE